MRRIAILLLSITALASTSELAAARDGCGPGRYWNGYRCAGSGYGPGTYGYGAGPYYGQRGRDAGNGVYQRRGQLYCYRPGFTVQDGVCKPYRGY